MAHEIFTPHHLADELSEEEAKAYKAIMKRNEEQRKAMEAPFSEKNLDLRMLQQFQALQAAAAGVFRKVKRGSVYAERALQWWRRSHHQLIWDCSAVHAWQCQQAEEFMQFLRSAGSLGEGPALLTGS